MKLTTIIILVACLHTSANGLAQQTVTFSGREVSLENVFNAIKKQTSYRFFFNTNMLQQATRVSIDVKNAPIEQVMALALKDQPLTYTIKGRTIFIMKKPEEEKSSSNMAVPVGDPITVSGKVTDDKGQPLVGANVKVKGSNTGVVTDNQGRFSLANVDPNATLEISFVGHETQLLAVKGQRVFSVALGQRVGVLDETVVIAYGTTTKRFNTGNVASVKANEIEKQPVQNPLLTLQGRVPGVVVTQNSGVPGGGVTVRIQGRNSIAYGNDPLYVIDGVPYFNQLPSTGLDNILGTSGGLVGTNSYGSPISYINPNDIESIEILKDADATSIYGSRAANGAILITTKKGKAGQMKLEVNLQSGWGQVGHKWKMLNSEQYLNMRYEALQNDGININSQSNTNANFYDLKVWDTTRYTDWQDVLIGGTAKYNNVAAVISGGTQTLQYLISGNYHKETTVFPGDLNDKKGTLHFSINSVSPNQKLRMQFSGSYMQDNNKLMRVDLTQLAVQLEPVAPALHNSDGSLNWEPNTAGNSTWNNPLAELFRKYNNKTNNLVGNIILSYQILPGLQIKSSLGYTSLNTVDFSAIPLTYVKPERRSISQRSAEFGNRELKSWIIEPQLTYAKTIGKGKLDLLIGSSLQQNDSRAGSIRGIGFNSDDVMENLRAATTITANNQYIVQYKYGAAFGRINYNWRDKYIFNLTGRRDGTSRFGSKSQFHNFGSVGCAWLFGNEVLFTRQNVLSFGKLRSSYGTTGSDQIGDYAFMNLYNFLSTAELPYQNSSGIQVSGISNPYLEWEETKKLQVGLELGFLSDKIITNVTYSQNRSSNQLLSYALPSIAGVGGFNRNFPATVQNTNWEFSLNTSLVKNKYFNWTSFINFTIPKNKLITFPNLASSTYANSLFIGEPISIQRTYYDLGVDPSSGLYQKGDKDGNPVNSLTFPDDYVVLIDRSPTFYGGFQNNVSYKGIELTFLIQFVKQKGDNYNYRNGDRTPGQFSAGSSNMPITVLDRWQKPGDVANIAKYTSATTYFLGDRSFIDASYMRLKNLSISYQLPDKWQHAVHLNSFKIYAQGQNLLTVTNWKGLDPETQAYSSLPPLRVWVIGLQIGF